ncbi:GNAT family N-acetyltransferase [Paraliobacillus sp. X-1268]|uniref:GNAT family N-acetyltransferase n=1 Tax=Paraliobacillus sp. X-1268 TaxID=2213193 RepID=UPI000E3D03B9|nr:GNAT family protein [Paraliobacillus sp. X-1268]
MYKAIINKETYISILEPMHAEELYQLINRSRETLGEWLSFPAKTNTVADSHLFIEKSLKNLSENNGYWAGIWYKENIAGSIGYLYMDWRAKKTEIGYWLDDDYIGKGLETLACKQLINHAFNDLQLRKVEINVANKNIKSKAIPERLGFKQEGVIRNYEYLNGEYHDRVIYGMLLEEWKNATN